MNETESKLSGLLPLGVVGEKSFSDPTSDTCKNKTADRQWILLRTAIRGKPVQIYVLKKKICALQHVERNS